MMTATMAGGISLPPDFDRLTERRNEAQIIDELLAHPGARIVPMHAMRTALSSEGPLYLSPDELTVSAAELVLLGRNGEEHLFAVDLESEESLPATARASIEWVDLWQAAGQLDPLQAGIVAYARGMLYWHRTHRYCGRCGAPNAVAAAGHERVCTNPDCAAKQFPRTDPAIITVVEHGERILLGRQANWPPLMYSTLAGFVEPGESLEQAVAREVKEETGVIVEDVRYFGSQPWPFPASLMLGFFARAVTTEIRIDPTELADAQWFHRDEIEPLVDTSRLRLPRNFSIASMLIDAWRSQSGVRSPQSGVERIR